MSTQAKCSRCGAINHGNTGNLVCCGRRLKADTQKAQTKTSSVKRDHYFRSVKICQTNDCGNYSFDSDHQCNLHPQRKCLLPNHLLSGGGCFADPSQFTKVPRIAVVVPNNHNWHNDCRGPLFRDVLIEAGYIAELVPAKRQLNLDAGRYDLICIHVMVLDIELVEDQARRNPLTQFVIINHSAISHLETFGERYVKLFTESLKLAKTIPNVWYGSQEPIADHLHFERSIWMPSPGMSLCPRRYRLPPTPTNVVIAGRLDSIKNNLAQTIACSMVSAKVRLNFCTDKSIVLQEVADVLGVDCRFIGQLQHAKWIEFLRNQADVVLCCSLAESFGFVAAEAMQVGVPVVGSKAIRFADPVLVANHNDALEIADAIDKAITDHSKRSEIASNLAQQAIKTQQQEYLAKIAYLLKRSRRDDG